MSENKLKENWIVDRLTAERKRRGIPQEKLAEHMGVGKNTISKWETGTTRPSIDHAIVWAVALGFHLDLIKQPKEK